MTPYFLLEMLDEDWAGVALGRDDPELDDILAAPAAVQDWVPPRMEVYSGELTDYLPSNVGMRLVSPKLRGAIDDAAGEAGIQWLAAIVSDNGSNRVYDYFVLHLTGVLDALNLAESEMARADFVLKPVLDPAKLNGERVFIFSEGDQRVVVDDVVRRAIEAAGCTGVGFSEVPISGG